MKIFIPIMSLLLLTAAFSTPMHAYGTVSHGVIAIHPDSLSSQVTYTLVRSSGISGRNLKMRYNFMLMNNLRAV
jgi:hypothetical protein